MGRTASTLSIPHKPLCKQCYRHAKNVVNNYSGRTEHIGLDEKSENYREQRSEEKTAEHYAGADIYALVQLFGGKNRSCKGGKGLVAGNCSRAS